MPGRKSIVFFSNGLSVDSEIAAAMDRVTDLANRSAVSIYGIDPAGLRARLHERDREPRMVRVDATAARFPTLPGADDDESFAMQAGLEALSARSGGILFRNRNDVAACIREAADDQLGYYLLGFSRREGTFETAGTKAKLHHVAIRVRRPSLTVRWRSGFEGVADELIPTQTAAVPRTRKRQLLDALASLFTATALRVKLTSEFNHTKQLGPVVHSMLFFEGRDLTFQREADGDWHATADIVTSAYRGLKLPIEQWQRSLNIRLTEEQYRKALREGFLFNLRDQMKQPGTFLLRAVVRDATSARIGSASQLVQVPDTRRGQLAMSGIYLQLAHKWMLDPKVSVPAEEAKESAAEGWTEGGPATRRYRAGQTVLYAYRVINAKVTGPAKESRVKAEAFLFRNGKLIFTAAPALNPVKSEQDADYLVGGGGLVPGGHLPPGEYLLQVLVTDQNASGKQEASAIRAVDGFRG
jgi:hypothetical protein